MLKFYKSLVHLAVTKSERETIIKSLELPNASVFATRKSPNNYVPHIRAKGDYDLIRSGKFSHYDHVEPCSYFVDGFIPFRRCCFKNGAKDLSLTYKYNPLNPEPPRGYVKAYRYEISTQYSFKFFFETSDFIAYYLVCEARYNLGEYLFFLFQFA